MDWHADEPWEAASDMDRKYLKVCESGLGSVLVESELVGPRPDQMSPVVAGTQYLPHCPSDWSRLLKHDMLPE